MNLPLALAISNESLIGAAAVAFIICAVFWVFGRR